MDKHGGQPNTRGSLILETFEARSIAYRTFRETLWSVPEIVAAFPDREMRETMVEHHWKEDPERRFAEHLAAVRHVTLDQLLDLRADLLRQQNVIGSTEYRETLAEAARKASPDQSQDQEIER